MSLSIAARNVALASWNRAARLYRRCLHWSRRRTKEMRESGKHARAQVRRGGERGRDMAHDGYASIVRTSRYWNRLRERTWPAVVRDVSARRTLRAVASGSAPILVGPWLSEVGYETLYWVPFVRWFARQYHIDPARLVALSRGGVAAWYGGIVSGYVEQFDLFTPDEFAARNEARQRDGDQKQLAMGAFDEELLARARERLGIDSVHVCHPSAMFGLLRQFWLGNESLQSVLDCTGVRADYHASRPWNCRLCPSNLSRSSSTRDGPSPIRPSIASACGPSSSGSPGRVPSSPSTPTSPSTSTKTTCFRTSPA